MGLPYMQTHPWPFLGSPMAVLWQLPCLGPWSAESRRPPQVKIFAEYPLPGSVSIRATKRELERGRARDGGVERGPAQKPAVLLAWKVKEPERTGRSGN